MTLMLCRTIAGEVHTPSVLCAVFKEFYEAVGNLSRQLSNLACLFAIKFASGSYQAGVKLWSVRKIDDRSHGQLSFAIELHL